MALPTAPPMAPPAAPTAMSAVPNRVWSCNHTCTLMLMLQGNLMVDSTDFRTGGNENAASHSERRSRGYDMPNIRLLKKAANEAAGEVKPEAYPWGTLRISMSRERRCQPFSASR